MSDSELQRTLGGIEAMLKELLRRADNHDEDRKSDLRTAAIDRQSDVSRIASLELWRSYISGGLAILGIFMAFAFKLILDTKGR